MPNHSVAVVIPYFNNEDTIKNALKSVFNQTIKPNEIIIIDDGSSTPLTLPEFQDQLILLRTSNGGQGAARNLGINKARSNIIAFLDADDAWRNNHLQSSLQVIKNFDVFFTCSNAIIHDEKKERIFFNKSFLKKEHNYRELVSTNFIITSTVVAHKNTLMHLNGFNENRLFQEVEDYELWLKVIRKNQIICIPSIGADYYLNRKKSKSTKHRRHVLKAMKSIMINEIKYAPKLLKAYPMHKLLQLYFKGLK